LPIPQIADGQVPLCYFIRSTPPEAATEFRLGKGDEGNVSVRVRLAGKRQKIKIAWSSIVLLAPKSVTPNRTPVEPYREATACVQSGADQIDKLAKKLWPKSGKASEFAANIQRHIQEMKGTALPRPVDALGILKSGQNGICTANANLAAALLRSKGIACRSAAVIPPISQRLEMHRIAEFAEDGRWIPFDPSSLRREIPAKPWQNIIMAKTTIKDEETAMKPRMSVMIGCPYGQEIEMLTPGVTLFGVDMFWTEAKTRTAVPVRRRGWSADHQPRLAPRLFARIATGTLRSFILAAELFPQFFVARSYHESTKPDAAPRTCVSARAARIPRVAEHYRARGSSTRRRRAACKEGPSGRD
jgi:hypothetical protein